jgi:hypothetical protein
MVSRNLSNGLEVKSINYTIQREGGHVHKVQVDPADYAMTCTCPAGVYGRLCWAQRMVQAGQAPKPRVRVSQRPPVTRARTSDETRELVSTLDV